MYTKSLALLTLATANLANADFYLYSQQSNDIVDSNGGGFQTQELLVSAGEVACGDGVAIPGQFYNDASDYGWACDGCDTSVAVEEMNIERLEIYNGEDAFGDHPIFNKATDSITLYQDRGYEITGGDGIVYGTCERITENPDDYVCSGGALGSDSGVILFTCTSELTPYVE